MADRTVSVRLQAQVTDYMTKMSAAGRATSDLAHKVDIAKGKAAQGYHAIGVAGVAMGAVVAGGFAVAVKSAADFESKMALVRTLAHASEAEMAQLSNAALHVGQAYGYSAGEVADAEAELVKAGVSVKDIMGGALAGALTLAAAGQADVAEATTIAATAMTQFALSGKDVPHIADLLAAGADKALGSVTDIGYALDQAGLEAHRWGISIEETIGTLAAFAQAGQVGERGGTVFAQMLAQLSNPSNQAADIIKRLGLNVYDAGGEFVGLANFAGQLHNKMADLTLAERNHDLQVIFGQRAIRGATILYQEGAKGIEEWTERVTDQGFAALQAAGKLDSLSGDVTKLKTALQTAFIGVGEGGQGPLREMVQDVTKAVEVWNGLPGPVRAGAEALVLVGGAVTLAGGAALLFIPRWTAMNAALAETKFGALSARGALLGLGKVTGTTVALVGVYEGVKALHNATAQTGPSVEKFTADLIAMGNGGADASSGLINAVSVIAKLPFGLIGNFTKNLDTALADLVTGGHADLAAQDFTRLSESLHKAGYSTAEITDLFPGYAKALANAANNADLAAMSNDGLADSTANAAKKTKSATDRAKDYADALHALADPLFAMNQALQGVTDAQAEASHATRKFGADSAQARQANLNLASAALDVEASARSLAAGVRDGSVSLHDARGQLRAWAADGLITKQQADDIIGSFDHLIGRAQTISGLHPHVRVTADTSQPESALSHLISTVTGAINAFFHLGEVSGASVGDGSYGNFTDPGHPGYVPPSSGRHHSGSGGDGGGYTPTPTDTGYYVPSSSGGGGSGGGGRSKADKQHPPTAHEIAMAILAGTSPENVDLLGKQLQRSIDRLTGSISSAQQYRSTIRSNLLGYASLSNVPEMTDSFGNQMGKQHVNAYLKGRLANLRQFVHLRHRLENAGAGEGLLAEFEAIGPDANAEMRQLLSGGRHAVQRANRLEHRIKHVAADVAGESATDRYGRVITNRLDHMPREIAHDVAKALRHQSIEISLRQVARQRARNVRKKT